MAGDLLPGGRQTEVERRGDIIHRSPGPWSPAVVALLRHLEDVGFSAAPRVVGSGFDLEGRETLTFIEGTSPHPHAWSETGAAGVGRMLSELHDATASFVPPPNAVWQGWFGRSLEGDRPVIGHCDLGPWNILARAGVPVAMIDWEFAGARGRNLGVCPGGLAQLPPP